MSRRKRERPDSLEMLLDTMCNAFGGIILIAILLALLARTANQEEGDKQKADEGRRKLAYQIATNNLETVTGEANSLSNKVASIDPAKTNLWITLTNKIVQVNQWSNKVARMDDSDDPRADAQADAMSISNRIAQLDIMIASAKTELERWKGKEGEARNNRERITVKAPEVQARNAVANRPIIAMIKGQKFIQFQKYDRQNGGIRGLNLAHVDQRANGDIHPKPNAGWPLPDKPPPDDNWVGFQDIFGYCRNFPRAKLYCYLYVDPDSFGEARVLISQMQKMGISVGWEPEIPIFNPSGAGRGPGGPQNSGKR